MRAAGSGNILTGRIAWASSMGRRRDAHELPERIDFAGTVEGDLLVVVVGGHGAAAPRLEPLHGGAPRRRRERGWRLELHEGVSCSITSRSFSMGTPVLTP